MATACIMQSLLYVINGPYFWASMGFTSALAMFVGAALYDGQIPQARKGLVGVLSYAGMLLWVTITRINETTSDPAYYSNHPEYAYAGILTTLFVTIAWVIGVFLGISVFAYKYRGKKHI